MNIFETYRQRTISRDLLFGLALATSLLVIFMGTLYFFYNTHLLRRESEKKNAAITEELSKVLLLPLWDLNEELIRQISTAYLASESLAGIRITCDRRVFFDKMPDASENLVRKSRTISLNGLTVGAFEVIFSDKMVRQAQGTMIYSMVFITLSVILALVLGTHLVVGTLLNRPLYQLIQGIRTIADGNYQSPLVPLPQHDLDSIVREVNYMAGDISEREQQLKRLNTDLEMRIIKQEDAERALAESEKKYREIFENALGGIYQSTLGGQILNANPTMAKILGYDTPDELMLAVHHAGTELYVTPGRRDELIQRVEKENRVSGFECRLRKKNGGVIWVSLNARGIRDMLGNLTHMEGTIEDITHRKQVETELAQYREHLEEQVVERTSELIEANQALQSSMEILKKAQNDLVQSEKMAALGGLVAGVAHEINTPVGIGVTAASFLERKTKEVGALFSSGQLKKSELEKYMGTAMDSTASILVNLSRAAELIQSFKNLAVDQTTGEKRRFDLRQYLDNLMLSLKPKIKRTKHTVKINCPEKLILNSHPGAIMQIITNLLMNALIHGFDTIEEGVISIDVFDEKDDVLLRFGDNGEGMNEEQQKRIFDPFYTTKRSSGGTGLGMHIVFNLVTRTLGGKIACESALGKGTVFTIRIPKEKGESDA